MSDHAVTQPAPNRAAIWKRVTAAILDFFTVFFVGGYAIGSLTGDVTSEGFHLTGMPALILFAVVAGYFYIGRRQLGGTLWDRIFRITRPQPK